MTGEQVYCLSKDQNDTNVFESSIVLGDNFNLNNALCDENAFNIFSPFFLMNRTVSMLSGST